jgi:hypothetical protein
VALDSIGHRLFIGYRHPASVRVVDAGSGKLSASLPCVGDADDVFYDAADGLVEGGKDESVAAGGKEVAGGGAGQGWGGCGGVGVWDVRKGKFYWGL